MAYRVEVSKKDQYIRLDVYGERNVEDAEEFLRTIAREAKAHGERNVLVVNHLTGRLPTIEIYDMISRLQNSDFGLDVRVAAVYSEDETYEDGAFGANVAQNRGRSAEAFTDEERAIRWLTGFP